MNLEKDNKGKLFWWFQTHTGVFCGAFLTAFLVAVAHWGYCRYYYGTSDKDWATHIITLFGWLSMLVTIWFGLLGIGASYNAGNQANRLEKGLEDLQEVVRFRLNGIPSIMGPAIHLVDKATDELFFMTFTPFLGAAHLDALAADKGESAVSVIGEESTETFEFAVNHFREKLEEKIKVIPKMKLLIVSEAGWKPFFEGLKLRGDGYNSLDVNKELTKLKTSIEWVIEEAVHCHKARVATAGALPERVIIKQVDSIPFQMLAAKLKPRFDGGAVRWGCLVFMVGSETVGLNRATVGFYTEVKDFMDIFMNVGNGLFDHAEPIAMPVSNAAEQKG